MLNHLAPLMVAVLAVAAPALTDKEAPPASTNGLTSPRLALPVVIRFDKALPEGPTPITPHGGGVLTLQSEVPRQALSEHSLSLARRHFKDASWGKTPGKGREVVIQKLTVLVSPGPNYQATVVLERRENGERLGLATGQGWAAPDRTSARRTAAVLPGLAGAAASHDASKPKADKDAPTIETAVLRAMDNGLYQLSAYWGGEQEAAKYRKGK